MTRTSFYFDPHADGIEVFLGRTEARVMEIAWDRGPLTVKKALFYFDRKPLPAYTTLMTVMTRLVQKGILKRSKAGRGFVYAPAADRKQFLKERTQTVRDCLKRNFK